MTTDMNITEGMVMKGGTNGTPITTRPQDPPSLYPSDGPLVYTSVLVGCQKCTELKQLLEHAGEMSSMVRYIVGGIELTTGYKRQPINVADLGAAINELRKLVDEYDKAVLVDMERGKK